jgi:hypothetical protein
MLKSSNTEMLKSMDGGRWGQAENSKAETLGLERLNPALPPDAITATVGELPRDRAAEKLKLGKQKWEGGTALTGYKKGE